MEPIRIFIVEDHHVVRMGLQMMLRNESDMIIVGTAAEGNEALGSLSAMQVDVLLTDLRMPTMGGDTLLQQLRKSQPFLKSIVLTNYHSDEEVFRAITAGAMGYVLKTATMEQILEAIRSVYRGERFIPANIAQQVAQRVSRTQLSPREHEVLQLIAKGLRNREIADQLFISENTVRNHMLKLLEKLGTTSRTEALAIAVQQGLVQMAE
jgi:DNA-binding NarL/FixJ family response regulator